MQIHGPAPAHLHAAQNVHAPHGSSPPGGPTKPVALGAAGGDEYVPGVGKFVDQARQLPNIRADRVQEIKTALASGTYDVDSRLDLAVSRLLDEIA